MLIESLEKPINILVTVPYYTNGRSWPIDPLVLKSLKLSRGVRKMITGLWQPSIHSTVTF